MTDRIHPSHDATDHGRAPFATPLNGSTEAIGIPENAIHKKQEKGLMPRDGHAQMRQNDDLVYSAPPLANQSSTGGSYPLAAVSRRPRRRSGCCCCLLSFIGTLGILILIVGIATLVVYLLVRPIRKPKFTIEGIEVREFNVTNRRASVLNAEMALKLEASNPNKKIGIAYDSIEMKVFYKGEKIGEGSIPGFYQGHKISTLLTIPIEGHNIALTSAAISTLQSNATVWMAAEVTTRASVKIGRWRSWRHTFLLQCSLHLSSSPHPGPLTVLSSSCKLKLKKLHFFFFSIHT